MDNLVWQISLSCLGPKIPWAFIPWKVPLVFPTFVSEKAGITGICPQLRVANLFKAWGTEVVLSLYSLSHGTVVFCGTWFLYCKDTSHLGKNVTSCILEWLTREGSSNLFLLLNKAFLAHLPIISQACFSLLPYLQVAIAKWQ